MSSFRENPAIWQGTIRRRYRNYLILGVGLVAMELVMLGFGVVAVCSASALASARSGIAIALLLIAAGQVVPALFMANWFRREKRLVNDVPANNGLVCPYCRKGVIASEIDVRCNACSQTYTSEELRTYWEQYVLGMASLPWMREFAGKHPRRNPFMRAQQWIMRHPKTWIALATSVFLLMLAGMSLARGRHFLSICAELLPMLLIALGIPLIIFGSKQRFGYSKHCAACGYEKPPSSRASGTCPECNADWTAPGGTAHGQLRRRPAMLCAGICVLALCAAMFFLRFKLPYNWHLRYVSNDSLITDIIEAPRGFVMDEWAELQRRTLTPEEEIELARGLIGKASTRDLSSDDRRWMDSMVEKRQLPQDIIDDYFNKVGPRSRPGSPPN